MTGFLEERELPDAEDVQAFGGSVLLVALAFVAIGSTAALAGVSSPLATGFLPSGLAWAPIGLGLFVGGTVARLR